MSEDQKFIPAMTGYKATDSNMKCRGFQFEMGKWYEIEGEIGLCSAGFHFCDHPSGPWAFYSDQGTRVFKVEAEFILDLPIQPGADHKRVARRVKFTEEIIPDGNRNTGNGNTGYSNTGYSNTGYSNTGYSNTGNRNTGNGNTGYSNTGNSNTGNRNTGNSNTGNSNTGNRNTGNRNTGNGNTGNGNATDWSSGFFNIQPQNITCFDVETGLTRDEFTAQFPQYYNLSNDLLMDLPIPIEKYVMLPGITEEKLMALHQAHIAGRTKK